MTFKSSLFPAGKTSLQENYLTFAEANLFDNHSQVGSFINWGLESWTVNSAAVDRSSPIQFGSSTNWSFIATEFGIKSDGTLWGWGNNAAGNIGDGTYTNRSSPVQIGSNTNWKYIEKGGVTAALKTDGTLWTWGNNFFGMLGQNIPTFFAINSPVQVGTNKNWKEVSASSPTAHAIKTDGTLWSWGYNGDGKLGVNLSLAGLEAVSSPVQVGTDTNWKTLGLINSDSAVAIKSDGSLWGWGKSAAINTEIGLFQISSPVQVQGSGSYKWRKALVSGDNMAAITSNNELRVFGYNQHGIRGNNTAGLDASYAVQVGTSRDWKDISLGPFGTIHAIKFDGTLWAWGANQYGMIGDGTTISRSSPIQISANTFWKQVTSTYRTNALYYERPV
jgi:alpha-tubulin suppressor-like RCC1 family protein